MDENYEELKRRAVEYYAKNKVAEKLEEILNDMFLEDPKDINGRLAEYFDQFSFPPVICDLKCKQTMSCCGNVALKCCVNATVRNHKEMVGFSQISFNNELNYVEQQVYSEGVDPPSSDDVYEKNCKAVEEIISHKLRGIQLYQQREVDQTLRDVWTETEHLAAVKPVGEISEEVGSVPTPSSGKKKKTSAKQSKNVKGNDKPVPPKEPTENRLLGFSAVLAASLGVLKSASNLLQRPSFEHLHHTMNGGGTHSTVMDVKEKITMPTVAMTVLCGGKNAPGKLNIFKNVFVIMAPGTHMRDSVKKLSALFNHLGKPVSTKAGLLAPQTGPYGAFQLSHDKLEQPLDAILEAATATGLTPGQDVYIGLDCSAGDVFDYEKGKYEIMSGALKSADDMVDVYRDLVARYPAVVMLVDSLRKEDREQWLKLCEVISEKCFVIGGEAIYGSLHNVDVTALTARQSSGVAISNGGRVTCSDLFRVVSDVRATSGITILTSSPDDVCDDIYSDLAVGLGVDLVVFGAPSRGENIMRLNRIEEIEEIVNEDEKLRIGFRDDFRFPHIKAPAEDGQNSLSPDPTTPDSKGKKK